jgi:hypothetical protein
VGPIVQQSGRGRYLGREFRHKNFVGDLGASEGMNVGLSQVLRMDRP